MCWGWSRFIAPLFPLEGVGFRQGETQIHLILEHEDTPVAGEDMSRQKASSRYRHFAFEVEDGHKAVEQLKELGVPLLTGSQERPDGAVQLFVRDPDGYVVELCSAPLN